MTEMTITIIIGLLVPLLGTMLGSAFVLFMKDEMSARLQKTLLGFASGVMVAASVWSSSKLVSLTLLSYALCNKSRKKSDT